MDMREEFEAHMGQFGYSFRRANDGEYYDGAVERYWSVWQSALQSQPAMGSGAEPENGIPPEGIDLIVKDGEYGPWIARWNDHLKVFTVAHPADVDCLPAGCAWWYMPYTHPAHTAQDSNVPEWWLGAARTALSAFKNGGDVHKHPATALEHIRGLANIILSAAPSLAEKSDESK